MRKNVFKSLITLSLFRQIVAEWKYYSPELDDMAILQYNEDYRICYHDPDGEWYNLCMTLEEDWNHAFYVKKGKDPCYDMAINLVDRYAERGFQWVDVFVNNFGQVDVQGIVGNDNDVTVDPGDANSICIHDDPDEPWRPHEGNKMSFTTSYNAVNNYLYITDDGYLYSRADSGEEGKFMLVKADDGCGVL